MTSSALVIVAHPSPASFSHAIASAACEEMSAHCEVNLHDLYAERFDPVQPTGEAGNRASGDAVVESHCRELAAAGLIVVVHPNWWGQPPAILKGWIDRVFRPGVAYDYPAGVGPAGVPAGLLRARAALVFNTSNTPAGREAAAFGDPLENLWGRCIFGLCGVQRFERRMYGPMASSTPQQRNAWLGEVRSLTRKHVIIA